MSRQIAACNPNSFHCRYLRYFFEMLAVGMVVSPTRPMTSTAEGSRHCTLPSAFLPELLRVITKRSDAL